MHHSMKKALAITVLMLSALLMQAQQLHISQIHIRDPFILVDGDTYYMYATSSQNGIGGVAVYSSKDLENWSAPKQVLTLPEDNWSTGFIWAPEVHKYKGKYYIFATVNCPVEWKQQRNDWTKSTCRGTQVFRSSSPTGPFKAISKLPQTPMDYMALDGTLFVEDRQPYMVFCHEWVQLGDGTVEYVKLSKDLSSAVGNPVRMFCGSAFKLAPPDAPEYVTDGCFLYRTKTGKLLMIWATFGPEGYAECIAESVTGKIYGPWRQQETPLFSKDGGHAMIFTGLDGRLRLVLHAPNSPGGAERACIFLLEDTGDTLRIIE